MIVNSTKLFHDFLMKYASNSTDMNGRLSIQDILLKPPNNLFETLCEKDTHYARILSILSTNQQIMFIRFFEVFLFRIYSIKLSFRLNQSNINWNKLQSFIKSNQQYEKLFYTCFHFYF